MPWSVSADRVAMAVYQLWLGHGNERMHFLTKELQEIFSQEAQTLASAPNSNSCTAQDYGSSILPLHFVQSTFIK